MSGLDASITLIAMPDMVVSSVLIVSLGRLAGSTFRGVTAAMRDDERHDSGRWHRWATMFAAALAA